MSRPEHMLTRSKKVNWSILSYFSLTCLVKYMISCLWKYTVSHAFGTIIWTTEGHCVQVNWNASAGQLWPHVSRAAAGPVGDLLNPQLAINKPKWISNTPLNRFDLEDEPPNIFQ